MSANLQVRHGASRWSLSSSVGTLYLVRTPATASTAPGHGQNRARYLTMEHATERWLPVVGFEGFYEVSSLGRVRSVDRIIQARNGRLTPLRGKIRRLSIHQRGGYPCVGLNRPGTAQTFCIHRLVVMAFHGPAPEDKPVIRHLNGNPLDNRPDNLAWGTCAENTADMMRHGRGYWANKTHCKNGHEFTAANTRLQIKPNGGQVRSCRTCERERARPEHRRRALVRRDQRPVRNCMVCGTEYQAYAMYCSEECRRICRRKEFGWNPTLGRREARRRTT